jgi:hypothetical protein
MWAVAMWAVAMWAVGMWVVATLGEATSAVVMLAAKEVSPSAAMAAWMWAVAVVLWLVEAFPLAEAVGWLAY